MEDRVRFGVETEGNSNQLPRLWTSGCRVRKSMSCPRSLFVVLRGVFFGVSHRRLSSPRATEGYTRASGQGERANPFLNVSWTNHWVRHSHNSTSKIPSGVTRRLRRATDGYTRACWGALKLSTHVRSYDTIRSKTRCCSPVRLVC